ncbi:MAG: amidohydrolase [Clostridia bacterium]|nr:amidohydrolase [Clostridia bacterium]MBR3714339.1 amidohydrolase [Clostridia bacterium]
MNKIFEAVEKHRGLILEAERHIWKTPETGYKEFKTSKYMAEKFEELGYSLTYADGITGFYTVIDTGKEGPEVLVLCELDSVICPEHKDADPETGAVHSCGHNAQCATMLGIAAALKEDGMLDGLSGKIMLCAVPAEELLEIEYRTKLKNEGKIKYFGGKSEFLHRGYFDGVDIAFMVHTSYSYSCPGGSVGCIAKRIIYKGKASHAGGSPWDGINALYAANCGINALNAIRETFKDHETIRVHPIITSGGAMVNAIPECAVLESYVRGKNYKAIVRENKKVNRALIGAALSLGANVEIIDTPGYAPNVNDKEMIDVARDAAKIVLGEDLNTSKSYSSGSTDMGDLSCIMPTVHPYCGGARGTAHGNDFEICDPEAACVTNAKWQLAMLRILLENEAERAKKILADFKPLFSSKEEFLSYQDSLASSGDRIVYGEDGTATVKLD